MQALRRMSGLFGRKSDRSSAKGLAVEEAARTGMAVAEAPDFGQAADFAEGTQDTVAVAG